MVAAAIAIAVAATILLLPRRPSRVETTVPSAAGSPAGTVKFMMEQQWLIRMKLARAEPRTLAPQISSVGRIVPAAGRQALVAPPVGGIVTGGSWPRVGQLVARGQILAVLTQTPTAAEAAQIEAGRAQVRIEQTRLEAERRRLTEAVNEAEARLKHAREEFERGQRLYEAKAYSLRQLHATELEYKAALSTHAAAVAQRDVLVRSRAESLSVSAPTRYTVTAPISGVVVGVRKPLGAQVAAGEIMLEIIDLDIVWVEAPVFERDLHRLAQPIRAVFTTPAYPGREFGAHLVNLGAVIGEQSRAATALFEVLNPQHVLRVGMQANVRLDAGERVEAFLIPKEAVLEHEGKKIVYVLASGEDFQRREVAVGDEYGDRVAILSGLRPGERVVTQGAYQLRLQELRPAAPGAHTHET
jgi:RND family efflux transporter MFP subunit